MPKLSNPNPTNPAQFQIDCAVPKSIGGHIIGRGGAKIKATRETSGAVVKVLDHVGNANFRGVIISGTIEQCRTAYSIIAEQVCVYFIFLYVC